MIGEKIKFIRTEKGITGKELAEKAEVTPGYISQIERNLISPSLSVLMRIAEVLEIPLVSLFTEGECVTLVNPVITLKEGEQVGEERIRTIGQRQ